MILIFREKPEELDLPEDRSVDAMSRYYQQEVENCFQKCQTIEKEIKKCDEKITAGYHSAGRYEKKKQRLLQNLEKQQTELQALIKKLEKYYHISPCRRLIIQAQEYIEAKEAKKRK